MSCRASSKRPATSILFIMKKIHVSYPHLRQLESIEGKAWSCLFAAPEGGPTFSRRIAGGTVFAFPQADILALNRVVGLGLGQPTSGTDLDEIIDFYREAGAPRFFIQLSPQLVQADLDCLLKEKGFGMHNRWTKLQFQAHNQFSFPDSALKVRPCLIGEEELFGHILCRSFGWKEAGLAEKLGSMVYIPGFHTYLIRYADRVIAAGALFVKGQSACLIIGGTLPGFRGLGAQSLLIQIRIRKAIEQGCTLIAVETGEDLPDRPVSSYRNLLRHGFKPMYFRANWIYEF